jgi:alpha-L-fucosidase
VNGESIYGTSASPFERLSWGRATRKGRTLYLHVFDAPTDRRLRLPGLRSTVAAASLLAAPGVAVATAREGDDVVVTLPATPTDAACLVVRIELADDLSVDPL